MNSKTNQDLPVLKAMSSSFNNCSYVTQWFIITSMNFSFEITFSFSRKLFSHLKREACCKLFSEKKLTEEET